MALTRHLREPGTDGAYPPDSQRVRAINRVAAALAKLPQIESYLTVLALLDGLLPPRTSDLTFDALGEFAVDLDPYFKDGAARAITAAWKKLDGPSSRGILVGLTVARGQELVRRLEGKPPVSCTLPTLLSLFAEQGAPLHDALRFDEAFVHRAAGDLLEEKVTEAIGKLAGTPQARIEAARAIMDRFDEVFQWAFSDGVREVTLLAERQELINEYLRRHAPKFSRRRNTGKERNHQ